MQRAAHGHAAPYFKAGNITVGFFPLRGIAARGVGAVRGADSGDPGRQVTSSSVAAPSLPVRYGGPCGRLGLAR